jgi:hypothetical protein
MFKLGSAERLCEYISNIISRGHMGDFEMPSSNTFSNIVMLDVYVLRSLMEDWIL